MIYVFLSSCNMSILHYSFLIFTNVIIILFYYMNSKDLSFKKKFKEGFDKQVSHS